MWCKLFEIRRSIFHLATLSMGMYARYCEWMGVVLCPFYDSMTAGHTKLGEMKSPDIMGVDSSYVARNFPNLSRCVQC